MLAEVPYSDSVTNYLTDRSVSYGLFFPVIPVWSVYLQPNTGYWVDFIGHSESVGDGIAVQVSFSGTAITTSLLMQFSSGTLVPVSLGDTTTSNSLNESWHYRGFVRTRAGGKLQATFSKVIDFSGDTAVLAGSVLTVRSLGGGGASRFQVSEDRILLEDESLVLLENAYSLEKEQ